MEVPVQQPTLGELARTLERLEAEVSRRLDQICEQMSHMITRDLHNAHLAATQEAIAQIRDDLRTERERRAADRRMVTGALLTAALSLVVTVVGAALMIALRLQGGA